MSKNDRNLVKKHLKASRKAINITKSTGEPIQVTTSIPGKEENHENNDLSDSQRDNQNLLISSSYKSTKNGIVESIITVKGVPKTIIEPAHNWDENSRSVNLTDDEEHQGKWNGDSSNYFDDRATAQSRLISVSPARKISRPR